MSRDAMVKTIQLDDGLNFLMLTAGYVQDSRIIRAAMPRYPEMFRRRFAEFPTTDLAAAWTLSALSRRSSYDWRHIEHCGGPQTVLEMPLHTWLLGHPSAE